MIIHLDDIVSDVAKQFPELTETSIKTICKKGLKSVNKIMRAGDELILTGPNREELKFFTPATPENQAERAKSRYFKHKKKRDAKRSSNK